MRLSVLGLSLVAAALYFVEGLVQDSSGVPGMKHRPKDPTSSSDLFFDVCVRVGGTGPRMPLLRLIYF